MDPESHQPQDVITGKDVHTVPTLLDDVFALEKRQEAAVLKAAAVLGEEFGGQAKCLQYKIQEDGTLLVVYTITKPQ